MVKLRDPPCLDHQKHLIRLLLGEDAVLKVHSAAENMKWNSLKTLLQENFLFQEAERKEQQEHRGQHARVQT